MLSTFRLRTASVLGLGAFLIFLTAFAPASILASALSNFSNGRLSLTAAEGTIWQGRGHLSLSAPYHQTDSSSHLLGQFSWQLQKLPLLWGNLDFSIVQLGRSATQVRLNRNEMTLQNITLILPIAAAVQFFPALQAAQPAGLVEITGESLTLGQADFSGSVKMQWRQASTLLSPVHPLGHYQANINGVKDALQIQVSTLQGPLRLEGSGSWRVSEGLRFNGTAAAEPTHAETLKPLLHTLANRVAANTDVYVISYQ